MAELLWVKYNLSEKQDYSAGADTKEGKHEPHVTPSLLSSISP